MTLLKISFLILAILGSAMGYIYVEKKDPLGIYIFLFFFLPVFAIGFAAFVGMDKHGDEKPVELILEEAIEDAGEIGYVSDAILARIDHELYEEGYGRFVIKGTETKKEEGEETYIQVKIGNKSYYVSRSIE